MPDDILLDDIRITFTARPGRPDADSLAARRVLLRGGFLPRLRKLVRQLVREYPDLRNKVSVGVAR